MGTEIGDCPALRRFVLKGVSSKDKARSAIDELTELIGELENWRDEMESGLADWEEGEDAEARAKGRDQLENASNGVDEALTNAGRACGMADYEPPE